MRSLPILICFILLAMSMPGWCQSDRIIAADDPAVPSEDSDTEFSPLDEFVTPDQIAAKAFGPPPNATPLTKTNLWIDLKKKRVYFDGYIAMRRGPLEMFACPAGSKEHESIVGVLPRPKEVHAALLAVGAAVGTPVRFRPQFLPPTGQRIRIWVCYRDEQGKFHAIDARQWIKKTGTEKVMELDFVFAGSKIWKDEEDGREYYMADGGDMICVSNFSSAMLDVPIDSSASENHLQYSPFTQRLPERGTPVRLVLVPIPLPSDEMPTEPQINADEPPTESVLPVAVK